MTDASSNNQPTSLRTRAADVAWRRRSTKGRIAVVISAVVVLGAISDPAGKSGDATGAPSTTSSTTTSTTAAPTTTAAPRTTAAPTTTPPTTAAPTTTPPTTAAPTTVAPSSRVARVVDGDTVEMADGAKVRLIGIDTPEQGECGYAEATDALAALVMGRPVTLVAGARDDVDRYGRLLRYLDTPDGDANLAMLASGWARARYDSRDGYGRHTREAAYVAASAAAPHRCAAAAAPTTTAPPAPAGGGTDPRFGTCKDAKRAGYGPYARGRVEYGWYKDADGDGVVCE